MPVVGSPASRCAGAADGTKRTMDAARTPASYHSRAFSARHRRVGPKAGAIRVRKQLLFFANALKQHHVDVEGVDDRLWSLHVYNVLLARIDGRDHAVQARTRGGGKCRSGCQLIGYLSPRCPLTS